MSNAEVELSNWIVAGLLMWPLLLLGLSLLISGPRFEARSAFHKNEEPDEETRITSVIAQVRLPNELS